MPTGCSLCCTVQAALGSKLAALPHPRGKKSSASCILTCCSLGCTAQGALRHGSLKSRLIVLCIHELVKSMQVKSSQQGPHVHI